MFFKLILTFLLFFSYSLKALEVEDENTTDSDIFDDSISELNTEDEKITVIELLKDESIYQLMLEQENNDKNESVLESEEVENTTSSDISDDSISELNTEDEIDTTNLQEENNIQNEDLEDVSVIQPESIFDIDEVILKNNLQTINEINSQTLSNEFLKILSNPTTEVNDDGANKKYFIIKKLYDMGEIRKSYNLIKETNLAIVTNTEYLNYLKTIELNYLLSTFKLSEVCELKSQLLDESVVLPNFLLEKTDIFCLTIENKLSEAKLLNSLLLDKEQVPDLFFQQLLDYTFLENKEELVFENINSLQSKDLIFLYSAMLRINELPLTEKFIEIDPLNLSIPVILSDSTEMKTRIKAVNKSFNENLVTIDILSALYQSVDFNTQQFNEPEQTIQSFNQDNELTMAFYYQLANRQIFPEDRLRVIIEYWDFAKNIGLEKIAYSLSENIVQTFNPSLDTSKYSMQIAMAHISNKNYTEASKWLNFIDEKEISTSQLEYVKFLIELNENNEMNTIVSFLESLNNSLKNDVNIKILETIDVLNRFLMIKKEYNSNFNHDFISDQRVMPSYFMIQDINQNINNLNNLNLLMLTIISMENKNWHELHPEHLLLLLKAFKVYDQGSLIKSIILEILSDLNVTK